MAGRTSRSRRVFLRGFCLFRRSFFWRGRSLFQVIEDLQIVISGIELGPKCAPCSLFEGYVYFTQFFRRKPESNHMPYPHHDAVRDDFNAIRREVLNKASLGEMIVNLVQCFTLVVSKDDRKHDFTVIAGILGDQRPGQEKEEGEQR